MVKGSNISEEEVKEGDKKTKPVRDVVTGEVITGKIYPGPMCLKTYTELTNPDG